MRLLNTESLELWFFMPPSVPDYVILSHRWNTDSSEECTFKDIKKTPISDPNSPARKKKGFSKVQGACRLAFRDGYSWIWIDSCCIDRSSSAELQEAINSMWNYYAESNICYVYMADVQNLEAGWDQRFRESNWFTRGWTVQELIAPVYVEFYAEDWAPIGTKTERYEEIADITKINLAVLVQTQGIEAISAAEKLSWVAHRHVTREEDEAYSLLGLFELNMPLLYGEGREKAFVRLQEAIYNVTTDNSLFLFRHSLHRGGQPLLADSPTRFCDRIECPLCLSSGLQTIQCLPPNILYGDIIVTERWSTQVHDQIMTTVTPLRREMSTTLELLDYQDISSKLTFFDEDESHVGITHVAVLNYSLREYENGALCILLCQGDGPEAFVRAQCFPALLPHIGKLESKVQKRRILICPGPIILKQHGLVETIFCVDGDSFRVEEWDTKGSIHCSAVLGNGEAAEFEVQTGDLKRSAQISCQVADSQDSTLKFSLQLLRIDKAWSIKEVSENEESVQPGKKRGHISFPHLTDRCSLVLSGGKSFSVALRRQPAGCRTGTGNSQFRYQIVLKYL